MKSNEKTGLTESRLAEFRKAAKDGRGRLSWNRFLNGGSLRSRSIQPTRSRGDFYFQRRQVADTMFEAEQESHYLELVKMCQNSLRGEGVSILADKILNPGDQLSMRQAAILQLLELEEIGRLRQILAHAAETPPETDKNLSLALFNVHKSAAFAEDKIFKKAPDLAIMGFDIERRPGKRPRIAFREATAEELMTSLGNVSLDAGVELDISSWRVSLGLEPVGTEDDLPPVGGNPAASALRQRMIDKIERIAGQKRLEYGLTRQHQLLFRNVLDNKRLFLA